MVDQIQGDLIVIRQRDDGTLDVSGFDTNQTRINGIAIVLNQPGQVTQEPQLKKAKCILPVYIRSGPGLRYSRSGYLQVGQIVSVIDETQDTDGNIWLHIGFEQYCAFKWTNPSGVAYVFFEYVEEG